MQQVYRSGDHRKRAASKADYAGARNTVEVLFTGEFKAAPAVIDEFPDEVHPDVVDILTHGGKRSPYSHQAECARAALCEGTNVGLVTPTASGKTIAFLAPVLSLLVNDREAVALLTYPTKALAADQLKGLRDLGFTDVDGLSGVLSITIGDQEITAGVLDGDTDERVRGYLREHGRILLSNPPAIHQMILRKVRSKFPDGTSFGRIVRNLKCVVIDECHFYHGSSGTQASFAFRRLFAIVDMLTGRPPLVIVATATIGNAQEHLRAMTGMDNFHMVTTSGAARQRRLVHIARPATYQRNGETYRYSVTRTVSDLAMKEMASGKVVLIFTNSRAGADAMAAQLGQAATNPSAVAAFHSGLPKAARAQILDKLFAGVIRVIVATSALELGIDLGNLDTVIVQGHPGDNASFGQRCGRVGRTREGTVYLVLNGRNEMDVYLSSNPKAAFWPPESRTIYTDNKIAKSLHAACALLETRSSEHTARWLGEIDWPIAEAAMHDNPHDRISMIGLGNLGKTMMFAPDGGQIGELSTVDALKDWHYNAILRSPSGRFYRVESVHFDHLRVQTRELLPAESNLNTAPITELSATPFGSHQEYQASLAGVVSSTTGEYDVQRQTTGFYQLEVDARNVVVARQQIALPDELLNPTFAFETRGVDIKVSGLSAIAQCCAPERFPSTVYLASPLRAAPDDFVQAVNDVLRRSIPVVIQARGEDIGLSVFIEPIAMRFLAYDIAEGGMGWSEALFRSNRWFAAAAELLLHCDCEMTGCPRCSMAPLSPTDRSELADALSRAIQK